MFKYQAERVVARENHITDSSAQRKPGKEDLGNPLDFHNLIAEATLPLRPPLFE